MAPLVVWFTNLSSGAVSYSWDFGDGNSSTDQNPSNTYTNAGAYSVGLIAIGPGGSDSLTRGSYILVNLPPPLVLSAILSGDSFVLSFPSVAGKTYDIQYKDLLSDSVWQSLQIVSGNGSTISITNSVSATAQRYFRVKAQ